MMDQHIFIAIIIASLACIQSVFGIGLLVFGTPTLLLIGLNFSEALGWLLPASIAISTIQTLSEPARLTRICRSGHLLLCLIPLVACLAIVLWFDFQARLDVAIGVALILAAAIRYNVGLQRNISRFIASHERTYLIVMGAVHGFTNMGGALLAVYATTQHQDKHDVRGTIATYYLMFAGTQIVMLAIMKPSVLGLQSLVSIVIAVLGYSLCGHVVFKKAPQSAYNGAVTCFIAAYGVAVLLKSIF
jgi:uncharacterized membrane protein YfcA